MTDYTGGSTKQMQLLEFFIGLSLNFDFLRIPTGVDVQGWLIPASIIKRAAAQGRRDSKYPRLALGIVVFCG
jgi:hypothetical protein